MEKWYPQISCLQSSSSSENEGSIFQRVHVISNSGTTKSTCMERIPTQNLATPPINRLQSQARPRRKRPALLLAQSNHRLRPMGFTPSSPCSATTFQSTAHSTNTSPFFDAETDPNRLPITAGVSYHGITTVLPHRRIKNLPRQSIQSKTNTKTPPTKYVTTGPQFHRREQPTAPATARLTPQTYQPLMLAGSQGLAQIGRQGEPANGDMGWNGPVVAVQAVPRPGMVRPEWPSPV
jgi:hypothetical protein